MDNWTTKKAPAWLSEVFDINSWFLNVFKDILAGLR